MSAWVPDILPCPPRDRVAALDVLYRRVPASLRPRLIADALTEADRGVIDLAGLWNARRGRVKIHGAMLTQPLAGKAAAVWAPEVDPFGRWVGAAIALVRAVLADLEARGYKLAQALLDESAPGRASADLVAGGMPRVPELVYLERGTTLPLPLPPDPPPFDWVSFTPETDVEFRAVLEQTYRASLDMPELEGVRSLDDIISSQRAGSRYVPDRWRLGRVRDEPDAAGVGLLSALSVRGAWEVAYLGLTPAARGRGLGRAVLGHALQLAAPHAPRLELAVDLRNVPAHRLYRGAGFIPFDRRAVHLVLF